MFEHDGVMGLGMGIGMWVIFLVFVLVLVLAVKGVGQNGSGVTKPESDSLPESPLDILKARYARGEIDDKEYEHRRRELEQQ